MSYFILKYRYIGIHEEKYIISMVFIYKLLEKTMKVIYNLGII